MSKPWLWHALASKVQFTQCTLPISSLCLPSDRRHSQNVHLFACSINWHPQIDNYVHLFGNDSSVIMSSWVYGVSLIYKHSIVFRSGQKRTLTKLPKCPYLERTDESVRAQTLGVEDLELDQLVEELGRRGVEVEEEWLVPAGRVCGLLHAGLLCLVVHRHSGDWLDVGPLELSGLDHLHSHLQAQVCGNPWTIT